MSTAMPPLETTRLLIRPCRLDDLNSLRRIGGLVNTDSDDQAADPLSDWLAWSIANYHQLARLAQPPYGDRAIELRKNSELIGLCGVVPTLLNFEQIPEYTGGAVCAPMSRTIPEVGLYYHVAEKHRRNGYASEAAQALIDYAFEELRLRRIVATTTYDNEASARVMRRLGMRIGRNPFPEPPWLQVVGILDNPAFGA